MKKVVVLLSIVLFFNLARAQTKQEVEVVLPGQYPLTQLMALYSMVNDQNMSREDVHCIDQILAQLTERVDDLLDHQRGDDFPTCQEMVSIGFTFYHNFRTHWIKECKPSTMMISKFAPDDISYEVNKINREEDVSKRASIFNQLEKRILDVDVRSNRKAPTTFFDENTRVVVKYESGGKVKSGSIPIKYIYELSQTMHGLDGIDILSSIQDLTTQNVFIDTDFKDKDSHCWDSITSTAKKNFFDGNTICKLQYANGKHQGECLVTPDQQFYVSTCEECSDHKWMKAKDIRPLNVNLLGENEIPYQVNTNEEIEVTDWMNLPSLDADIIADKTMYGLRTTFGNFFVGNNTTRILVK